TCRSRSIGWRSTTWSRRAWRRASSSTRPLRIGRYKKSAGPDLDKISIERLSKVFVAREQRVTALDDVSLSIPHGQFVCIVGPSGCGKTTLLRIVAGLEQQSFGQVQVARDDISRPSNSMIFQEQSIFPWMTVRDNVAYGLRMRR